LPDSTTTAALVRKDWQFKLANHLCTSEGIGMVFVEDLNLKAMSRGMLRKHTLDAAFGQFLNLLEWVAKKHQVYFARVNPDLRLKPVLNVERTRVKKNSPNECTDVVNVDTKQIEIMQHQK
jgi:hypothetical protein